MPLTQTTADSATAIRAKKQRRWYEKPLCIIAARLLIGALFVYSGFTKAIDPWGFIFKIEEYLSTWGVWAPRSLILIGAIGLSAFEFVIGAMLASGCYRRWAPRLLALMMCVMLPLTAYIWIANPVSDCGCFGDAFKISNFATFLKNIIISGGLIYLIKYSPCIRKSLFTPAIQWLSALICFVYIAMIALYGYNIQPLIDYRAYPEGTDLPAMLDKESDDDTSLQFVYQRDGEQKTFSIDNLPDSTWTFVDRITSDNNEADTFTIYDGDDDVTSEVISSEGAQMLLIIPEPIRADISYSYAANEIYSDMKRDGGDMIALLACQGRCIDEWIDLSMAQYPCYTVDDTSLKQLARGTMSLVYLRDGVIKWKRTMSSFEFETIQQISNDKIDVADSVIDDRHILNIFTIGAIALLTALFLLQKGVRPLWPRIRRFFSKKSVTLQDNSESTNISNR
jgi:uncharacterized membrane protein YphA (DoxX/SURF4 family)